MDRKLTPGSIVWINDFSRQDPYQAVVRLQSGDEVARYEADVTEMRERVQEWAKTASISDLRIVALRT